MAFTIAGQAAFSMNATQRSLDTLRVSAGLMEFHSAGLDTLTFTQECDDATGAGPVRAEEDQYIELFQNGNRRFKGIVESVVAEGTSITTVVRGPWHWMELIDLTGNFIDDNGNSKERTNFVLPTQGLRASLESLVDRIIALGVPMTRGTVNTMFEVMKQSLPNMSCADAIAQVLLWCPDAVLWFDYSGTVPELNITRRDNMTPLTYTVGTHNLTKDNIRIKPRKRLRVSRVVLNYMDRHPTSGKKRFQTQVFGAATTRRIQQITISGPETVAFLPKENYENYSIKTSSATIDSAYVLKVDSGLASISGAFGVVGTTVITYEASGSTRRKSTKTFPGLKYIKDGGGYVTKLAGKYLVISADPPDWVLKQYNGVPVTITGTWIAQWLDSLRGMSTAWNAAFQAMRVGAATGSGFEKEVTVGEDSKYKNDWLARAFSVRGYLINTNFATSTTVYKDWDWDFISPPADLAENLRDAQNWVPYEGSVELVADEWTITNHLNRKLRIGGSLPEHATMDALLRTVSYDLMNGRMTLQPGPPARTDFSDLIQRIRREPTDNFEYLTP